MLAVNLQDQEQTINDEGDSKIRHYITIFISYEKHKLSIDTYKPNVAKYALLNGFSIINDIKAGAESLEMFEVFCITHNYFNAYEGVPQTMQNNPH